MKRQKTLTAVLDLTKDISLSDIWRFLSTETIPYYQLYALGREIDRLYSNQLNSIVQRFPTELWAHHVFPHVGSSSSSSPSGAHGGSGSGGRNPQDDVSFWLDCRTVSKSWKSAISKFDFSSFALQIELTKCVPSVPLSLPPLYPLFSSPLVSCLLSFFRPHLPAFLVDQRTGSFQMYPTGLTGSESLSPCHPL
jgi:hypothetical protein